jgi:hypothetical protein
VNRPQSETPDPAAVRRETKAMNLVAAALEPLSPDERRRVLEWARRYSGPVMRGEGS